MAKISLAAQLYTLRDLTKDDFAGTIKQVAGIGYQGVELAGWGNLTSAQEARKALDDAGLKVCGAHIGIEVLEKDLNQVLDDNEVIGNKNIICPWMPAERRSNGQGWQQVADGLSRIAAECKKRQFALGYHNHDFEFQQFDGKSGLDILWGSSDPKLLRSELDVYWVKRGGLDPVTYINQLGKRLVLIHLKDMAAGPDKHFAPVGTGILDMPGIIQAGQKAGVKWYVVEQDDCYGQPPMEAIKTSFDNVRKLGVI